MDLNLIMNSNLCFNFELSPLCKEGTTVGFPALGSDDPDDPCIWSLLFKRCSMCTPLEKENNRLYQRKSPLCPLSSNFRKNNHLCFTFLPFKFELSDCYIKKSCDNVIMIINSHKFRVVICYLLNFKQ